MSEYNVRLLNEPEYNQWDQLVVESEQGTIFHLSKWIAITAKFSHSDYAIIGVFYGSQLIGGCSFYLKKIFYRYKIGYTNNSLTPYGGFVFSPSKSKKVREFELKEYEIISLILKKIKTFNLVKATLINSPALLDIRPFLQQGWRPRIAYTYIVPLNTDIFSMISYSARRCIRKSQKIGITVKKEYNPDIFWKLTKLTYKKQNKKVPFQKEYLFALMEMLVRNNLGEMWIAKMPSGNAASAVFIVYDAHMAHGWVGANDPECKRTGVVSHLLFEVFMDFQNRGFRRMNIMAGNIPHLAKFYSIFNPQLVPYYGVEKVNGIGMLINLFR